MIEIGEELMPRPSLSDDYVRRRAAEIIFPDVARWAGPIGESEKYEYMNDLMSIASQNSNGYEMAKSLEHKGWCSNDSLVEILGNDWVTQAIDELTSQWVRCLNITPEFSIGDLVTADGAGRKDQVGTVVKIDSECARYGIRYPDMPGNSYQVIGFELCRKANNLEDAA